MLNIKNRKVKIIGLSLILSTFVFQNFAMQKIKNSLLAGAYGDALGRVTEFKVSNEIIFEQYKKGVRTFDDFVKSDWENLPEKFKSKKIAPYTDDTAMALLVTKVLLDSKKNNYDLEKTMDLMARVFVDDAKKSLGWKAGFRAPGICCKEYVDKLNKKIIEKNDKNKEWWKVSLKEDKKGGCGSVMHAYPFGLVFSNDPEKAKVWAAEHSMFTHGDPMAVAACAAMAVGTAYAIQGKDIGFIIDKMISTAREYDPDTADTMLIALGRSKESKKLLKDGIDFLDQLNNKNKQLRESHDKFFLEYKGWDARSAIAGVIYLFSLQLNVINTIYFGVHTPGDSDSIASLAGALCGACSEDQEILGPDIKNIENYDYMCNIFDDVYYNKNKAKVENTDSSLEDINNNKAQAKVENTDSMIANINNKSFWFNNFNKFKIATGIIVGICAAVGIIYYLKNSKDLKKNKKFKF